MKIYKVDLKCLTCARGYIYENLFVVAETEEEAGERAKKYLAISSTDLLPVKIVESSAQELLASSPRIGKGMVFPHENGKDYPVKLPKNLLRKDICEKNGETFYRIKGSEGISDCNGNIYCYYYNINNGLVETFMIGDYNQYIEEVRLQVNLEK